LDEHLLIQKYFSDIGSAFLAEHNVEVPIGDDASFVSTNSNTQQVNSIDTSIEGVHFLTTMNAEDIAYRSCVVALSDLAACGARPQWYSIAITLPELDEDWLQGYSSGLKKFSEEYRIPLIGGDTTKGSLTISVQVMGEVDKGKTLLRSKAKADQLIFVSGVIGDAYLGLIELQNDPQSEKNVNSYLYPKARIDLGLGLIDLATAAIDISDGLIQDLELICNSSGVGAEIYFEKIPTSKNNKTLELINSGDDYELCFTADEDKLDQIIKLSKTLNIPLTEIGRITSSREFILYDKDLKPMNPASGYKHF
jgi:thiamine-monophosphate kinase